MKKIIALAILLTATLIGCQSEFDQMMEECEQSFPEYAEQMEEIHDEWLDALDIAASTSRISLSGPVTELQSIRREANNVEPPACVEEKHESYVEGLDEFIDFFLEFMTDADTEPDEMDINLAMIKMLNILADIETYNEDPEAYFSELRTSMMEMTAEAEEAESTE